MPQQEAPREKGKRLSCERCCQAISTTDVNGKRECSCTRVGQSCGASQCCSGVCDGVNGAPPSTAIPTCVATCAVRNLRESRASHRQTAIDTGVG